MQFTIYNLQFTIKQSVLILIFIFSFFIFNLSKAYADFSLAVNPPILQIEAKPPANVLAPISIENLSGQPVELNIILKPFEPSDQENGQIRYLEEIPSEYSLIFQRVRILDQEIDTKSLVLGPKQKKDLILNINLPRDAAASDYYFSIVFARSTSSGQVSKDRSGTELVGGIAINVLLSTGEKQAKGQIQEFSAPLFIEKGPVPFTVRVKNTGSHYTTPKGEIIIKNLFGQTVGKVELLPVNILAGSVRSIPSEGEIDKGLWKEKFVIGPYIASLNLAISENGPALERQILFFAFPGITILVVLGILITLLYFYSRIRMKIN